MTAFIFSLSLHSVGVMNDAGEFQVSDTIKGGQSEIVFLGGGVVPPADQIGADTQILCRVKALRMRGACTSEPRVCTSTNGL